MAYDDKLMWVGAGSLLKGVMLVLVGTHHFTFTFTFTLTLTLTLTIMEKVKVGALQEQLEPHEVYHIATSSCVHLQNKLRGDPWCHKIVGHFSCT